RVSARLVDPINRVSLRGFERPAVFWLTLVAVSIVTYVPALVYFGPNKWFELGPFSVQASRILLYFAYFFIGASVGAANFDRGILSTEGQLPKSRWLWVIVTLIPYCLLWGMIYIKRVILGNPDHLPDW
ncbi:acyltransferase, partial [Herbaspirillum sp. HC18]